MRDIKTRPAMDKPKVKNHDFVPKEAGNIWKHYHEQQEAQRGPKERDSVQYATEKVEAAGKRGSLAAAYGGRKAIQHLKQRNALQDSKEDKREAPTEPQNGLSTQEEPSAYPSAKRDGNRQMMEQHRRQQLHAENVEEQHKSVTEIDGHNTFDVPRPRVSRQENTPPRQIQMEQGRRKAVRDAIKSRTASERVLPNVEQPFAVGTKVDLPQIKTRQSLSGMILQQYNTKTPNTPPGRAASNAMQRARRVANNRIRQKMIQQSSETAQHGMHRVADWTSTVAKAVLNTTKAAVNSAVAAVGGGSVVLLMLLLLILVGAIVASPFGILFSNESSTADAVPISAAIAQVTYDFNSQLEMLQKADAYDDVTVEGDMADWIDVLVIFAVKTAGSDDADATDVVTMDAERINRLKAVFADMNPVSSSVEIINHSDNNPDDGIDDSWTEKILHITITGKTVIEMETQYHFTPQQHTAVEELLSQRELLAELISNLTVISADAAEVLKNLPADLTQERREIVKVAASLVGKVNYFWGGKSLVLGWDSRWGTLQKVTATGSPTTGTYRPFGLDCSGFVDWVFYNASDKSCIIGHGGGAMMQHSYCTSISWADALPGDLVFYPGDTHVGVVAGHDSNGNLLIIHCASGHNNVVITGLEGFMSIGRPVYYAEQQ